TLARNFATLLGSRVFIGYVLVGCLFTGGLLAWLSGSSFVLIRVFGTAEENFGFLFGTVMMGNICGLILASRLQRRRGIDGMMRLGVMIAAAGGGAMAALAWAGVNATAAVIVPMMIFMLGFSLALPQTIAGAMAPFPHIAGAASSLLGFLYSLVGVAVSMAIAGFYDGTQRPMATAIGLAGGMAVFAYAVMLRRRSAGA
ncbi:MAG: Bcr/CflA family drug resistance efflux transporter, partial [Rhodospirillales bacterium]|nr:Bcr/CflA family drug resistance efflux transporter [Rhodospirillales bacterium]